MCAIAAKHTNHHCCQLEPIQKPVLAQELATSRTAMLLIWGMGCPTCAMRVRNALLSVDGVLTVEIALEQGGALIRYDPARVAPETLPAALTIANEGRHRYVARLLDWL